MSYYFEPPSVALAAPPAVAGDLIVGRADGNFDRLAIGAAGQMLSVVGGAVVWGEGPLTTIGDLLIGSTAGSAPTRLPIGAVGQILSVVAGPAVTWGEGPLTTIGDLLIGSPAGAAPTRLPIGTNGQMLSVVGGVVVWGEGPLTTIGDLLIGSTAGSAPTRLPIGTNGQMLSVVGGVVVWGEGPLTTLGDLLVGATGAAPTRLAVGADGAFLNVSAGAIRWGNTIDTGGLTITAGSLLVSAGTLTVGGAFIAVGTTPATAGAIRVPYQGGVFSRDSTNTFNEILIRDNADVVELGAGASAPVKVFGPYLSIGTTPAATGAARLPNATGNGANFRNAANTADIIGMELDNADHLRVGAEVVGLGAGAGCVLSNAGAPGPTGNGQAAWVKVVARNGTLYWVPVWT